MRTWIVAACALACIGALTACGKDQSATPPGLGDTGSAPRGAGCEWPMWGQNRTRTFSYPCPTKVSPQTVKDLQQQWFFNTYDVVTATPAVADGSLYVGDWSGRFYALDTATGKQRWMFEAPTWPNVYAGQIVSSAAVADVNGTKVVFVGAARWLHALEAATGKALWSYEVGTGTPDDATEIESSPMVVDGKVIFGTDVHNREGQRAGVHAVDAATGKRLWYYDPDEGQPASGCVDVWGSPAVDTERRSVFFGTGSCDTVNGLWRPTSEAIIAIGLDDGIRKWVYQPHEKSRLDLDFAGAPNLFDVSGRAVLGLGNKDGTYYTLDRGTGEVVWKALASKGGATGGFIGPTAVARGIVAGGTAIGDEPFLHGLNAANGNVVWQQSRSDAVYGASMEANGVLFIGGNDFTLRALDLAKGDVLWSKEMPGVVAGGAVIVGDEVFSPVGIREPGNAKRSETSGVFKWGFGAPAGTTTTRNTVPAGTGVQSPQLTNPPGRCIGSPCPLRFFVVPDGVTNPTATMQVDNPFRVTVHTTNLGDPNLWVKKGSEAAISGAKQYGVFISESDDNPVGGLVCVIGADGSCTGTALPRLATYNRVTILAINDAGTFPSIQEGIARLVATQSFDTVLVPVGASTTTTIGATP